MNPLVSLEDEVFFIPALACPAHNYSLNAWSMHEELNELEFACTDDGDTSHILCKMTYINPSLSSLGN